MIRYLQTTAWPYLRSTVLPWKPLQLLIQTGLKWDRDNCPGMAAALSYYALFSLFPLLLVILSIVGALIGPDTEAFRYIEKLIVRDLPPTVYDMVVGTVIALNEKSVGAGIVGFSLLFFTASTLFAILRQSVNIIWESPARLSEAGSIPKMVLFFIVNKLFAYLLVLATALLLLTSLVANIFIGAVLEWVAHFPGILRVYPPGGRTAANPGASGRLLHFYPEPHAVRSIQSAAHRPPPMAGCLAGGLDNGAVAGRAAAVCNQQRCLHLQQILVLWGDRQRYDFDVVDFHGLSNYIFGL